MKKIFAKELAALAVLALAFTGCNTAFDGTNANFSEKESQYTDISGATNLIENTDANKGKIEYSFVSGTNLNNTNKKNLVKVTITSFSKINVSSADEAIAFQRIKANSTAGYYKVRDAVLPKTRIAVDENQGVTTITYEVDATGVTETEVALFVDAQKLKTKGGTPVLALDRNLKRGEESDCFITYIPTNGTTAITGIDEDFRHTYTPTGAGDYTTLSDASGKETGVYRFAVVASNRRNTFQAGSADDYESGLAAKLNDAVVIQYRKPGSRTYEEKKLSWTYHEAATTNVATDPYAAHSYTADTTFDEIGTEFRVILTNVDGMTAPAWYKDVYGHAGIVYQAGSGVGAKQDFKYGTTGYTYVLHKTLPSYIVVTRTQATSGSDYTSSYVPTSYNKDDIKTAQASFFSVTATDNWFQVSTTGTAELDPAAAKDFIVVDANNKKIAADVDVITYSYNDSNTLSGKVQYVKITVKDVRYRNSLPTAASGAAAADRLHVCVGAGTKIKENKMYPAQLTFGQWKDVTDDDASGYVQIN